MKKYIAVLLCVVMVFSLCGCAERQADDGRLQVMCTLFPYYDFVRAIGGDEVNVSLLVTPGKETHSFEPTPLDVVKLSQSDVLICNGGMDEVWVDDILSAAGENIAQVVKLLDEVALLEEEIAEGMEHDAHDHHDHDGHEQHIEYDEHIWTSPVVCMELVEVICEALCRADEENAALYRERTADYIAELETLDADFDAVTERAERRIMIFGDRFPLLYFCRTYGLDYRAAFQGCAGDTEPSLATLKYLIDKVGSEGIPVVYTMELSSGKIAEAIAETTGAQVRTFHTCQSITRQDFEAGETYLSLMRRNIEVLKEGLS